MLQQCRNRSVRIGAISVSFEQEKIIEIMFGITCNLVYAISGYMPPNKQKDLLKLSFLDL